MVTNRLFLIMLIGCFTSTLFPFWNQTGNQVVLPTPLNDISRRDEDTQNSKANEYTIQASLLSQLKTELGYSQNTLAHYNAIAQALEQIQQLESPVSAGFLELALNQPDTAIPIIEQAIAALDTWYYGLPAVSTQ